MAFLFDAHFQAAAANGRPLSGATLSFYRAGTTSKISVYQDEQATTPHPNPVAADASGTFPAIFIATTDRYKYVLKDADGITIQTVDRVPSIQGQVEAGQDEILNQLMGIAGGPSVVRDTKADLDLVTPADESYGGVALNDADPTKNGYYSREGGVWVFGRGFPDTFAQVELSGDGSAQAGTLLTGVNPAVTEVFFAFVEVQNDGAMTLSIEGEEPREVLNLAGNSLAAGEWTGAVMFALRDDNYQLLIDAGAAASAAQSATDASNQSGYAEEWAQSPDPISVDAGGDGSTDRSAKYWAEQAGEIAVPDGSITEPKLADALALSLANVQATRAGVAGVDTTRHNVAYLAEAGREGAFRKVLETSLTAAQAAALTIEDGAGVQGMFIRSTHDTDYVWMRGEKFVQAEWFGCVGDDSTDNSPMAQAAIDVAIAVSAALEFGGGTFRFSSQLLVTAGAGNRFSLNIRGVGMETGTIFKSYVTGAVTGVNTAGFLFLVDGMRFGKWNGFQIDYRNGHGGIVARCRNEAHFGNEYGPIRFVGGAVKEDRETNNRRSMKYIGNEPEANSTGYVNYMNVNRDGSFNTAYKHLEYIDGGGDPGTSEPNANFSYGCLFERYIIAIDATSCEEHRHEPRFAQQGQGVVGVNGGFTHVLKVNGYGHQARFSCESGDNSKPFTIGAASSNYNFDIMNNGTSGFDISAPSGSGFIKVNGRIFETRGIVATGGIVFQSKTQSGLDALTPVDGEAYIISNPGSGPRRLVTWDANTSVWRDGAGVNTHS